MDKIPRFDAVIDFSGYKKKQVKESVKFFRGKAELYVYISSDSVYEVCVKSDNERTTKETDDVRPSSDKEVQKLKRKDSYGHHKLSCEECIRKYAGYMRYVFLRLADVMGPCDSTDRWWQYQLWVEIAATLNIPIFVPDELKASSISLVYVKDVTTLIWKILAMCGSESDIVFCKQAYNLAFVETCTVEELLRCMHNSLLCCVGSGDGSPERSLLMSYSKKAPHIFPSVKKGPIDVNKAMSCALQWCPEALRDAVSDTVRFYVDAQGDERFVQERKDIYKTLLKDLKKLYDSDTYQKIKLKLAQILCLQQGSNG